MPGLHYNAFAVETPTSGVLFVVGDVWRLQKRVDLTCALNAVECVVRTAEATLAWPLPS